MPNYKPVGVDENSLFPPRVQAKLREIDGLPFYAPAGLKKTFDARASLYGVTPANNRAFATAIGKASTGVGVCHDVFIGASDMSAFDGTSLKAPLSWPEYYRQYLASNGVPSGGTGLIPTTDTAGDGLSSDSRIVKTGTWLQYGGAAVYTATVGDKLTFTPDVSVDANGKFVLMYENSTVRPTFSVKIGAAAAVTVTPVVGGPLTLYSVTGAIPAGTPIVVTLTGSGGALLPIMVGTIGTVGYHKHNISRSGTGLVKNANNNPNFNWDAAAVGSNYLAVGPQSYSGLVLSNILASRITISMGANDLYNGAATVSQLINAFANIVASIPQVSGGATIRLILPWHYVYITAANWETYATALYSLVESKGWQLADWRAILGNATDMANSGVIGADGSHIISSAWLNFGRKLALADLGSV